MQQSNEEYQESPKIVRNFENTHAEQSTMLMRDVESTNFRNIVAD